MSNRVGTCYFCPMRKCLIIVCMFLSATCSCLLADGPRFGYDIAQFRGDSGRTRVDVYIAVSDTQFVYKTDKNTLKGFLDFQVFCVAGLDTIEQKTGTVYSVLNRDADTVRKTYTMRFSFSLKPSQYTLQINVSDRHRLSRTNQVKTPLIVRAFSTKDVSVSDIVFCVVPDSSASPQVKKEFSSSDVIPSKEVCGEMPVLRTYLEVYMPAEVPNSDSMTVVYNISDAVRRPILDMSHSLTFRDNLATDFFEQQVHILPSGVYYVSVGIQRGTQNTVEPILTTKKFYILNPAYPPELSDLFTEDQLFLASEFAAMNSTSIQEEYEKAKRVGPDIELVSFQQLSTLNAKQKFLFRFWYHKDPNPTTSQNERYEEFKKAVAYAKLNYTTPFSPRGWDSDRGRVLLRYGFPTNVNRVIYNSDAAFPHETWEYDNIQGGVVFVFVDKRGSGNITLVHSTALNEHRDELWYKRYAVDPSQNR